MITTTTTGGAAGAMVIAASEPRRSDMRPAERRSWASGDFADMTYAYGRMPARHTDFLFHRLEAFASCSRGRLPLARWLMNG